MALTNSRERLGSAVLALRADGAVLALRADGSCSIARIAARRTSAGLAPTARNSAGAVEPPWSSSDSNMCHGSTVACPRRPASATAPVMTSRLLVVKRSAFICSPDRSTESGAADSGTALLWYGTAYLEPARADLSVFHSTLRARLPIDNESDR